VLQLRRWTRTWNDAFYSDVKSQETIDRKSKPLKYFYNGRSQEEFFQNLQVILTINFVHNSILFTQRRHCPRSGEKVANLRHLKVEKLN
jgi:hypothetical protein